MMLQATLIAYHQVGRRLVRRPSHIKNKCFALVHSVYIIKTTMIKETHVSEIQIRAATQREKGVLFWESLFTAKGNDVNIKPMTSS